MKLRSLNIPGAINGTTTRRFLFLWGPVLVWCGVIFGFSSIPTLPRVELIWWDFVMKKTAHIVEYGILYFLIFRAMSRGVKRQASSVKHWLFPFIFAFLYAISDELHQSFVPGRTARMMDVGFDTVGMFLSLWGIKTKLKTQT